MNLQVTSLVFHLEATASSGDLLAVLSLYAHLEFVRATPLVSMKLKDHRQADAHGCRELRTPDARHPTAQCEEQSLSGLRVVAEKRGPYLH